MSPCAPPGVLALTEIHSLIGDETHQTRFELPKIQGPSYDIDLLSKVSSFKAQGQRSEYIQSFSHTTLQTQELNGDYQRE